MTDDERQDVERELDEARDELYERLISPPMHDATLLNRWRLDLKVRRKEIVRLAAILEEDE